MLVSPVLLLCVVNLLGVINFNESRGLCSFLF
ncbi:hypothetical protein MCACPph1_CDS0002 [Moorella phage MCACPph1]